MKIKVSETTNTQLDWLVAKLARNSHHIEIIAGAVYHKPRSGVQDGGWFKPTTNPAQGHPILEREGISVIRCDDEYGVDSKGFCNNKRIPVWCALKDQLGLTTSTDHQSHEAMYQICETEVIYGPTMLIAGLRCYVASKLGDEVDVPDELV